MPDPDETLALVQQETLAGSQSAHADTLPAAAATSLPVTSWDRYEILGLLGEGGMGSVYRAVDRRLHRDVALKFIRGGDPRLTLRLLQEARAQARIDHASVCKVFEVGEVQGKAYIAMQLVRGDPLGQAM